MEEAKSSFLEIVIKEFSDKIKIHALKNGNSTPRNGDKFATLDLNHENILQSIDYLKLRLLVTLNLAHCNLEHLSVPFDENNCLKELNLSHNKLVEVPEAIFKSLGLLEHLDLSHNQISSFNGVPKSVYKLRCLRLNNNCFLNIPEFIMKVCCLNLTEFYYSNNEVTSMSSARFLYGGPYRLKKIELKNCTMRSEDLKYLGQIRTLKSLDLSNECSKNGNIVGCFGALEKLFDKALWSDELLVLKLNSVQMADIPSNVSKLVNMQELHLTKNCIMWLPDSISLLEQLRVLDVSENSLYLLPATFNKLKKLEIIKAANNSISRVPDLSVLSITHLDLYDNCLEECCSVNWNTVLMIDFEQNYFNTDKCVNGYCEKNAVLRQNLHLRRHDGPKVLPESDNLSDHECSSYMSSDNESCQDNSVLGEFRSEFIHESWSSSAEDCDNGCTASDNEWTGVEAPTIQRKKVKRNIKRPPSWMLEDTE